MSVASRVSDVSERYTLAVAPPVRPLVIASLVSIIGAALVVSSRALGLGSVALVAGIVALGLAAALVVAALILVRRLRSTLALDAEGITVIQGRRSRRLRWPDIDSVSLTGRRLTLLPKPSAGSQVSVINAGNPTDPTFTSLIAAIQGRLDASRGYRTG